MSAGEGAQAGLLIAAHGERRSGATNESVIRIAHAIRARELVAEVEVGFINGAPTIAEALCRLASRKIIVYPLFASNGYFTRDRLVQLIDEASDGHTISILPPLGLDPGLPGLVTGCIAEAARDNGFAPGSFSVVLLAHGSRRNRASREATEVIAGEVRRRNVCREVRIAFLEEAPFLADAARSIQGPAIVVGLFSGEGLHGARDAPRLIRELGSQFVLAGVIGNAPGIEDVIVHAVRKCWTKVCSL